MSIKTVSKFLIVFGVIVIVIAMTMDTSVSTGYGRVHNIGLVSQQQNMMILGGLAFIAGIILVATTQKSQSPDEKQESELLRKSIDQQVEAADHFFRTLPDKLFGALDRWITEKRDNKLGRLGIIFYHYLLLAPFSLTAVLVVGLYALRPVRAAKVITHLLYLHILLDIIGLGMVIVEDDVVMLSGIAAAVLIAFIGLNIWLIGFLKRREAAAVVDPVS